MRSAIWDHFRTYEFLKNARFVAFISLGDWVQISVQPAAPRAAVQHNIMHFLTISLVSLAGPAHDN